MNVVYDPSPCDSFILSSILSTKSSLEKLETSVIFAESQEPAPCSIVNKLLISNGDIDVFVSVIFICVAKSTSITLNIAGVLSIQTTLCCPSFVGV